MPKCKLHLKRKKGLCKGCAFNMSYPPADDCPTISAHDKCKNFPDKRKIIDLHRENKSENCPMSAVYDEMKSSPHPKKFRQRRKVKHVDVENSEVSNDRMLQFSGNTR